MNSPLKIDEKNCIYSFKILYLALYTTGYIASWVDLVIWEIFLALEASGLLSELAHASNDIPIYGTTIWLYFLLK